MALTSSPACEGCALPSELCNISRCMGDPVLQRAFMDTIRFMEWVSLKSSQLIQTSDDTQFPPVHATQDTSNSLAPPTLAHDRRSSIENPLWGSYFRRVTRFALNVPWHWPLPSIKHIVSISFQPERSCRAPV